MYTYIHLTKLKDASVSWIKIDKMVCPLYMRSYISISTVAQYSAKASTLEVRLEVKLSAILT